MSRWKPNPPKVCAVCGKEFRKRSIHCSRECYSGNRSGKRRFVEGRTGYVVISKGTWRQYEHRHNMEKKLGRKLLPSETVHHMNGDKGDNRLENLELWRSRHPAGQRESDRDIWSGTTPAYQFGAM
jgi:HNH endonuclease